MVLPSSARGCLCHPSCLLWFHGFWQTFEAAGCVQSVMSQPQKQDCHTLQRVDLARPFLVSPAIKIEIENSLEMALSKAKSGSAWQSHFLAVWNLATCSKHEALYITQINQSWVLFKQQAFNATGEDRLWESKFYIPFQPQKWASNKSNSSVTSSCACCGFLRSRLESQSWNSFNPFPHCKWGFSRCTDSARLRQDSAAKDIQTGTKLWLNRSFASLAFLRNLLES